MKDKDLVLNILGMNSFKQAVHRVHANGYQTICGRNLIPKRIVGTTIQSDVSCKICLAGGVSIHRLKQNKKHQLHAFAIWLNENDYHPLGDYLWQKGDVVPDPQEIFTDEDLIDKYLNSKT